MSTFSHDGLTFRFYDHGRGIPFVFQHGLGADGWQSAELAALLPTMRLLTLDCRAHGGTRPVGPEERIGFLHYTDDLHTFLDRVGIERLAIGGNSMGAGVAFSFALRYPKRVMALILSRPAWLDQPAPANLRHYASVAALIRRWGPERGCVEFHRSREYAALQEHFPSCAQSLTAQFLEPRAHEAVSRLERIPNDAPSTNRSEWKKLRVPTLVLASRHDYIHPFEFGVELANTIPQAEFREVTPKDTNVEDHVRDIQSAISNFLSEVNAE